MNGKERALLFFSLRHVRLRERTQEVQYCKSILRHLFFELAKHVVLCSSRRYGSAFVVSGMRVRAATTAATSAAKNLPRVDLLDLALKRKNMALGVSRWFCHRRLFSQYAPHERKY